VSTEHRLEDCGPPYVANARMYSVTDAASAAWQEIFFWLAAQTGVELTLVDHAPPAPLGRLWERSDLGCVFMCGWPIARAGLKVRILAAPIPRPQRYLDRPIYFTDIIVAANSPFQSIEETFGGTLGWTVEDSNSGFNLLRHSLLQFRTPERPRLFSRSVGGLINPLGVLRAVTQGDVDVAPLDSLCHDLFVASRHPLSALTRTIHTTPASPIPALVASASIPKHVADALGAALLRAHRDPQLAGALRAALVRRFVQVEASSYEYTERLAQAALAANYPLPA